MKELLEYYHLEREVIQSLHPVDLSASDTDTDSDTDSDYQYDEGNLQKAIESNAFRAMWIFGSHLGMDCDALHDRVAQVEFQQAKGTAAKRHAEDSGSERQRLRKASAENPRQFFVESQHSEGKLSEEMGTELHWENDSEEFRKKTAHLKLRPQGASSHGGSERESPREQEGCMQSKPSKKASGGTTEKMSSSGSLPYVKSPG